MQSVGYDMYLKILDETIVELKGEALKQSSGYNGGASE